MSKFEIDGARCPKCKTLLLPNSKSCICGWRDKNHKVEGGIKCLCGKMARINYNGFKCWPCYYRDIEGTDREDWRDKLMREKMAELDLMNSGQEPEYVTAKRARDLFKSMGGLSNLVKKMETKDDPI